MIVIPPKALGIHIRFLQLRVEFFLEVTVEGSPLCGIAFLHQVRQRSVYAGNMRRIQFSYVLNFNFSEKD